MTRRGQLGGRERARVSAGAVTRMDRQGCPWGEQGADAPLPERFPEDGVACSGVGEGQDYRSAMRDGNSNMGVNKLSYKKRRRV